MTRFIGAIYQLAPELGKLQAHHGVFASLGNHDLWVNAEAITHALSNSGIRVLINQGVPVYANGELIWLAGIDDVNIVYQRVQSVAGRARHHVNGMVVGSAQRHIGDGNQFISVRPAADPLRCGGHLSYPGESLKAIACPN